MKFKYSFLFILIIFLSGCISDNTDDFDDCEAGIFTDIEINLKILDKDSVDLFFGSDSLEIDDIRIETFGFGSSRVTAIEQGERSFFRFSNDLLFRGRLPSQFKIYIKEDVVFEFYVNYINDTTATLSDCSDKLLVSEVTRIITDELSILICDNCQEMPYIPIVID